MENLINIIKTLKWMLLIAIVIAIALMFINPIYTIIFCVSGITGLMMGLKCITAIVPNNLDEYIKELNELIDKTKNTDNNI